MDKFERARINKELKDVMHDFNEAYKFFCRTSREQYMKNLPAGSPVPAEGRIYTEESKNLYAVECTKLRDRARASLAKATSELKKNTTEAPSAEAVNSINLLKIRSDITEGEIMDLVDRYGSNVQAYKAIRSIAKENKIHVLGEHPEDIEMQNIENLSSSIDKAIVPTNDRISDGLVAMFNMSIDQTFPVED